MDKFFKAVALLLGLTAPALAQTYTQPQWGIDRTASPYGVGLYLPSGWTNFGTVSSAGAWSIPSSSITGFGTAANQNIGTSGSNVPLLSGANSWGGAQNFSGGATVPFTQSGTGAVATTVDTRLKETLSVKDFGATGNGVTNDTTAFQNCLNYGSAQGKVCHVPGGRYMLSPITVPNYTGLVGDGQKWGGAGVTPDLTNVGPTLLTTSTSSALITMQGGTILSGLTFYYPNQVSPSATTPIVYPPTILVQNNTWGGTILEKLQAVNAYDFITINIGRVTVTDVLIGALHNGIVVDEAQDFVTITNTIHQMMWDIAEGLSPPQTIDNWVMTNSSAIIIGRADSLHISNTQVFGRNSCLEIIDSSNVALSPRNSYGDIDGIDCDSVAYGIIASSTNNAVNGWRMNNVVIGANIWPGVGQTAQTGIYLPTGGTAAPTVQMSNVIVRGTWASNPYTVSAGVLRTDKAVSFGMQGSLTAPAVPATTVAQTNTYPFPVRVFVAGGTVSAVSIGGVTTGLTSGQFVLQPWETITLTYTVAPTWKWFGM